MSRSEKPTLITPAVLARWPLPQPDGAADKEERGRVLVVGGSAQTPGAVLLAANAALRAGAGKLRLAVPAAIAGLLAGAIPESRVFPLPETPAGEIGPGGSEIVARLATEVDSLLLGPGMIDEENASSVALAVLRELNGPAMVLDAGALAVLTGHSKLLAQFGGNAILTPHAGEMAALVECDEASVRADPVGTARRAADCFRAVVVLKGRETCIAGPGGECYRNRAGNSGLATSGSGDVLGGLIAGLAARGASVLQAAVWGVYLHAAAGDRLARKLGPLGYLARELSGEIPRLMASLGKG